MFVFTSPPSLYFLLFILVADLAIATKCFQPHKEHPLLVEDSTWSSPQISSCLPPAARETSPKAHGGTTQLCLCISEVFPLVYLIWRCNISIGWDTGSTVLLPVSPAWLSRPHLVPRRTACLGRTESQRCRLNACGTKQG